MFTVGDIGYLDADGYLYLCDRKGDMIISGGVNIYPAEIEAELSCHPAVADVAVFGIPHEEWGEEIKAVVQPADGRQAGPDLTAELLAFLDGRIARLQAAADHRLRCGTAARPQRQAVQAPPPRPVLGRPRPPNLKTRFIHQNGGGYTRSLVPDGDQAEGRQRDPEAFDVPGAGIDHGQLALPGHDEQPPAIG